MTPPRDELSEWISIESLLRESFGMKERARLLKGSFLPAIHDLAPRALSDCYALLASVVQTHPHGGILVPRWLGPFLAMPQAITRRRRLNVIYKAMADHNFREACMASLRLGGTPAFYSAALSAMDEPHNQRNRHGQRKRVRSRKQGTSCNLRKLR